LQKINHTIRTSNKSRKQSMQLIGDYLRNICIVLSTSIVLIGCSDCEPITDPGNVLVVSFFNKENFELDQSLVSQPLVLESFAIDTNKYPLDSLADNIYGFYLPIQQEQLSLQLIYPETLIKEYELNGETIIDTLTDLAPDILTISYSNSFEPISPDCGLITRFTDISIINTSFFEATVQTDFIETNDSTNIRIFF